MFSWSNLYYAPGDFVIKKFKTLVSKHYTFVEFKKKLKLECVCAPGIIIKKKRNIMSEYKLKSYCRKMFQLCFSWYQIYQREI